ncbi:MAG: nucleoside recognition protein [Clostridia bacterium]|jgi:spore maturation protein A|nr:nucleoside recognition protein [Clostridia bacterium]MCI1959556.1 nucleoside recognition protein [Clostridia bacterium]MCI1999064.1 nucleoside recognition protein [Clostridia bacterium]MCI2013814.1 nucleoside recognition protein [Clostridia bacterium]
MIDIIWSFTIIAGILFCFLTGNIETAATSLVDGAKEAVELCIIMAGTVSFWCGIMNIAEKSGLTDSFSKRIRPIIAPLFKETCKNAKAFSFVCLNIAANFLGLGWAATPAGLAAMNEMQKTNLHKDTATDDMCMFLIINISSVQLLPLNMVILRQKYMSAAPFDVVMPSIAATIVTTVTAIICAKICQRCKI